MYYTPFIRVEKGEIRRKDLRDIARESNEAICLVPQILPGSREEFRQLADAVLGLGYKQLDLNLGCPFPLIAGKKKGAGMLPYPDLVKDVLKTIGEYPEAEFSVKMRLGWEQADECMALADILNGLRLKWVTVHARTGKQQYKGETDKEAFARFYDRISHPVIYNGDIRLSEDVRKLQTDFPGLKGVAVGRGLLACPFLASEYNEGVSLSEKEKEMCYARFHAALFAAYSDILQGEQQILMKMKTFWEYFLPDADRKIRKQIHKATTLGRYREAIHQLGW